VLTRTRNFALSQQPLFRPEAVAANRSSAYGEIVLVRPISFAAFTVAACAAAAAIVGLFVLGTYTKHTALRGTLVPHLGLIDVQAPQYGTVIEKIAREGRKVERGDVLFVVSSERLSSARGATQQAVTDQLLARRHSIDDQIDKMRRLERAERDALAERITLLEAELASLQGAAGGQRQRVAYADDTAARYRTMRAQGFVSAQNALIKEEAALEQRSRLQGLDREHMAIERQLADARSERSALGFTYANRIAELERAAGGLELELAENEARRRVLVVAPQSGTIAALLGEVGQAFDGGAPLALIVPDGARLQAQLSAPSAAVGFVEVGDEVLLRYDAYPFQSFGHHRGTIASISLAALPAAAGSAPVYRVLVDLSAQTVNAYGQLHALRAGMAVEADVMQETKRLYEWVLDPLYRLTGKLH
jgi:membrane fusion protein